MSPCRGFSPIGDDVLSDSSAAACFHRVPSHLHVSVDDTKVMQEAFGEEKQTDNVDVVHVATQIYSYFQQIIEVINQ